MRQITIGTDPDSEKHGVAIYVNGKLEYLHSWTLMEIYEYAQTLCAHGDNVEFHIENVCGNNAVFVKTGLKKGRAENNAARSLGKCQQAQVELERALSLLDVKIVHHRISSAWKKSGPGKKLLKMHTGWDGQSNEDKRSAAYFGWLGCKMGGGK